MRRALSRVCFAALIAVPNLVLAQTCPAGTTPMPPAGQTVSVLVQGNTMCATRGADRWQEFHEAGGKLIDYKRGPGHPVDPTTQVGTWTSNAAASTVTHNYGTGGTFTWLVCRAGPPMMEFTLVSTGGAGTVTGVRMARGQVACP